MSRYQRPMTMEEKIVGFGPIAASDDIDVPRPIGDDQRGLGTGTLNQGIDGDGRAVNEFVDCVRREPALVQTVDNALHQIVGGGQALCIGEVPGFVVETDQIRKGAADIDCNGNHVSTPSRRFIAQTVTTGR